MSVLFTPIKANKRLNENSRSNEMTDKMREILFREYINRAPDPLLLGPIPSGKPGIRS